jgi:hypothetical protein
MLLSLIDNEEMRKNLVETDICRIIIREVEADNDHRELVLQIMINLSGDELFQKKFLEFNSIYRICNLLYQKLPKELESEKSQLRKEVDLFAFDHGLLDPDNDSGKVKVNFQMEKYLINPKTNSDGSLNSNHVFKEVPYYLMILTNLTISEEGQKKFLNLEDEKIKGIVFLKLLEKFFDNVYSPEFDFCANLIANATALKEGRVLLLELEVFKVFLVNLDKMNNHKVINLLRVFRNCCFEFEKFKDDLLIYNVFIKNIKYYLYLTLFFLIFNLTIGKTFQYNNKNFYSF